MFPLHLMYLCYSLLVAIYAPLDAVATFYGIDTGTFAGSTAFLVTSFRLCSKSTSASIVPFNVDRNHIMIRKVYNWSVIQCLQDRYVQQSIHCLIRKIFHL